MEQRGRVECGCGMGVCIYMKDRSEARGERRGEERRREEEKDECERDGTVLGLRAWRTDYGRG